MEKIWGYTKKILIGLAVVGAGLGLAGTRWSHQDTSCKVSDRTVEGSQINVTMLGAPIASHFNYTSKQGGKVIDSSSGVAIFFNVNDNAKEGTKTRENFCKTESPVAKLKKLFQ